MIEQSYKIRILGVINLFFEYIIKYHKNKALIQQDANCRIIEWKQTFVLDEIKFYC